ncbi:MAG TPA: hypothetical protein VNW99_11980, partial [Cytophagaceae bacterium]|nr:hypothetical protein [Cytophagaceae bacterium]
MKILFSLIFIFVYPAICYSQSEKSLERANAFFRLEEYGNAIKYYQLALHKENNKSIISQIANCYRLLNNNQEAQLYYEKIVSENPDSNTYQYALVLKKNGEYLKAKEQFKLLSMVFPGVKAYVLMGVSCDSSIRWKKQKSPYQIKNITDVNTEFSDISPVIYKNGIVYASNREETIIRKKTGYSEQPYYNLFFSSLNAKDKYHKGKSFSYLINTSAHESAPSFSGDFKKIYFTRVNENRKNGSAKDEFNRPKLYSSEEKGGHWTRPEKFIFNDSLCSFGQPSVDSTEKMFFFVSDMPGGFGG